MYSKYFIKKNNIILLHCTLLSQSSFFSCFFIFNRAVLRLTKYNGLAALSMLLPYVQLYIPQSTYIPRVPQCLPPRPNWDPPPPLPQASVSFPRNQGGDTLACGSGGGGDPIRTAGEKA